MAKALLIPHRLLYVFVHPRISEYVNLICDMICESNKGFSDILKVYIYST